MPKSTEPKVITSTGCAEAKAKCAEIQVNKMSSTEIATNIGKGWDERIDKYLVTETSKVVVKSHHLTTILSLLEAQKREMEGERIDIVKYEEKLRKDKEFDESYIRVTLELAYTHNSALNLAIGIQDANINALKKQLS